MDFKHIREVHHEMAKKWLVYISIYNAFTNINCIFNNFSK